VRRILASLACAAVLGGLAFTQSAFTQSAEPKPAFVMADIHVSPDTQSGIGGFRGVPFVGSGRYEIRRMSLLNLINQAYGVDNEKILGGPNWMEWNIYDINAKLPAESTAETQKVMLQNLLADRFKLVVHDDTRDLPSYVLTAGKTPKMKQSEGPGDTGCRGQLTGPGITAMPGGGFMINQNAGPIINAFTCHNMTMEAFATFLRNQVSQNGAIYPVTDQTELKGAWDFDFKMTLRLGGMMNGGSTDGAITIFDAVDKQLGLKLTQIKVPLKVLVVDSAQEPAPNAPGVTEAMAVAHPKVFEVAEVKPNEPGGRGGRIQITKGGGVNFQNLPLRMLINNAYALQNNMLITMPDMDAALQTTYTVLAKAPPSAGSDPVLPNLQGPAPAMASPDDSESAWLMMRALLEDRFKLKMHKEERPLTAWKLVAVKPKMKKSDPSERTKTTEGTGADGKDPRTAMPSRSRLVMFQNVTMNQFADKLEGISAYLSTPVINATNLEGAYDFTINFSTVGVTGFGGAGGGGGGRGGAPGPEANGPASADASEPNGAITLFEAIEQQLGLKLVEDKRPVTVYVIDHVEAKPTDDN
jgi:uncharacterized protein (TIGR03435 family)